MEAFARNHFTAPDDELCDPDGPPLNDYSTWTEYTVANAAEVARLRSEAAALRAAGDELSKWAASITPRSTFVDWGQRVRVVDAWRSAAGSPTTDGPARALPEERAAETLISGQEAHRLGVGAVVRWHRDKSPGGYRMNTPTHGWMPAISGGETTQYVVVFDPAGTR